MFSISSRVQNEAKMKTVFLLLVGLAIFACSPVFGAEFRKSIATRDHDVTAPTSSDVVQTFKTPSQFLEALLSGVGFLNRSEKHYPAGSNLYPRHCETMILYESNIRNLFVSRIEKELAKIRLLEKEKERCTRLLSLLENSSKDADIGNIASIDTKQMRLSGLAGSAAMNARAKSLV